MLHKPGTDGKALRFHLPHSHLLSPFGDDWFGMRAERFARFFGTPLFLLAQTGIVAVWILVNVLHVWVFDEYPFILLNLAFSLQAAYAAPLILLAQTRQADRDKSESVADAHHREELHQLSEQRERIAVEHTALLIKMMEQNTSLTEANRELAQRIETLAVALHGHIVASEAEQQSVTD